MISQKDNSGDDLTRQTREVWQPRVGRDLSRDEAKQIAATVTGFFSILAEWSRAELTEPTKAIGDAAPFCDEEVRDDS